MTVQRYTVTNATGWMRPWPNSMPAVMVLATDYDALAAERDEAERLLTRALDWMPASSPVRREIVERIKRGADQPPAVVCPLENKPAYVPTVCPVCDNDPIGKCPLTGATSQPPAARPVACVHVTEDEVEFEQLEALEDGQFLYASTTHQPTAVKERK